MIVRRATESDVGQIADFNILMALETESRRLDEDTVRRGVAAALADPPPGVDRPLAAYWVAQERDQIVGCLMVTTEWSDWRNGEIYWIQSVYVVPAHRRSGVFRLLFEHVAAAAKATPGVVGMRLYVDRDNTGAQAVYRRLGMEQAHYDIYEIEFDG
jgi:ribosomal protein S18 acetylase RimI-like enzyme